VEETLPPPPPPELPLLVAGETAIGELLAGKDGEALRTGNEFIADEVENEGMVGDSDRSESRYPKD
jgi:hypothetical protein